MKRSQTLIFSVFLLILAFSSTSLIASGQNIPPKTSKNTFLPKAPEGTVQSKPPKGKVNPKVPESKALPVVGSLENLKALLAKGESLRFTQYGGAKQKGGMDRSANTGMAPLPIKANAPEITIASAGSEAPGALAAGRAAPDYSTTNIQVQGVDEADIVKTDGRYIYQVNNRQVVVAEVYPAEQMKVVSTVKFAEEQFSPYELYVDQKYLVIIGNTHHTIPGPTPLKPKGGIMPQIYPPLQVKNTVKAIIYDNNDKTKLKKLREVEVEGHYVSSRKIGSSLYLAANKYLDYYYLMNTAISETGPNSKPKSPAKSESAAASGFTPTYRDSAGKGNFVPVGYQDIRYFPESVEPNYLVIAGLNLDLPGQEMQVSTYLGSGGNIFASQDNLYVAVTPSQSRTVVYKFALEQGKTNYRGKGEVPGTILNQFSMDEHKGYFRIATTSGEMWRSDEHASKNHVYVLNETLNLVGRLEDIAPGERIYSVRFIGDRAYMVTFKNVDPLFVIDLQDPKGPKVLGALKIPGYSDYLHPYDENHIIGFGKDTVELPQKDRQGNGEETLAFYQGMKIAVFDVSNVNHPVEKFKEIIGDRGTDSELLRNHKALLFARDKNLLAFPVTVMEIKHKQTEPTGLPQYGDFAFQGAYVYRIDLVNGFTLQGKITHLTDRDLQKSGAGWYDGSKNIERVLYIGDTLYTVSKGIIKANELSGLKEVKSLSIGE